MTLLEELPSFSIKFDLSENNDVITSLILFESSLLISETKFCILRKFQTNQNDLNKKLLENFYREINIILSLNSKFIIKPLFYCFKDPFIILEFLSKGDLKNYLKYLNEINIQLNNFEIFQIIYQLCYSIQILNENNIIHRDIKPDNIFIDQNNNIILGDFGLSRFENNFKSCNPGTIGYVSPEIINNDSYSFPSDIYSLGCTIFYILFQERPYHYEKSENKTCNLVKKINLIQYYEENNINDNFNNKFKEIQENYLFYFNLMKKCIELKPENRPNINEILIELNNYGENNFEDLFLEFFNNLNENNKNNDENGSINQIYNIFDSNFTTLCRILYNYEILKENENGLNELIEYKRLKGNLLLKLIFYLKKKNFINEEIINSNFLNKDNNNEKSKTNLSNNSIS